MVASSTLRTTVQLVAEAPDGRVRVEHEHAAVRRERGEPAKDRGPPPPPVGPDPADELPRQLLPAAGGHVGPRAPRVAEPAPQHAGEAEPARQVEEDDGVA